jgi:hypothetical protein
MNSKHVACALIGLLLVVIVQGVLQIRKSMNAAQSQADKAKADAEAAARTVESERRVLVDLRSQSGALIAYLDVWEPFLAAISTPEAGELNLTTRIKEAGLFSLAQRFEVATQKDSTISRTARAHLTFEDDYSKSLAWLGNLEAALPSARVSNLRLSRGQSGNDIKMELVIDIPLLKPAADAPTSQ